MADAPEYSSQQVSLAPVSDVRVSTDQPLEAFGGGQPMANVWGTAKDFGSAMLDIVKDQKQKADQVAHMQADTAASQLQTQIQVGVSKMKGQDAFGAPDYMDEQWQDGIQKIRDGLSSDDQRMAFDRSVSQRYQELNKTTQVHVAGESQNFDNQQTDAYIQTERQSAVLNAGDDEQVNNSLERQKAAIQDQAYRLGYAGTDIEKAKLMNEISATHKEVIQARLDSGIDEGAEKYFDDHKAEMSPGDILHAEQSIETSQVIKSSDDLWDKLSNKVKFSDGTVNVEALREKAYDEMDGMSLSDQRQEKVFAQLKARAREYNVDRNRLDVANERAFMNDVIDARKSGQSMNDAMKIAENYGKDPYDLQMKAAAVQKMYAPADKTDPASYMALWERVQDGSSSKQDIDAAMNAGKISVNDWQGLRKEFYKSQIDGSDPQTKNAWDRVKIIAENRFGSNKQDKEMFMYVLHTQSGGKTPDEIVQLANDKLKDAPGTGIIWNDPQWKVDSKNIDKSSAEWAEVYGGIGQKQSMAIGQAALYGGRDTWGVADIKAYANEFGGLNAIKQGTPANNAIQSLAQRGQLATPANVKAVLQRYPNGKY